MYTPDELQTLRLISKAFIEYVMHCDDDKLKINATKIIEPNLRITKCRIENQKPYMDGILKAENTRIELSYPEEDKLTQLWAEKEAMALNNLAELLNELGHYSDECIALSAEVLKIAQ